MVSSELLTCFDDDDDDDFPALPVCFVDESFTTTDDFILSLLYFLNLD